MESRIAATARVAIRTFSGHRSLWRGLATSFPTGRTADPAVHSGEGSGDLAEAAAQDTTSEKQTQHKTTKETADSAAKFKSPFSAPKLESKLNQPVDPITQQKRPYAATAATVNKEEVVEQVSCIGGMLDPWPEDENENDRRAQRADQERDDTDCYSRHKASPLSEIELAETRKPVSQASDGTAGSNIVGDGGGLILFKEEQLDTAEDALRRAMEMWKEAATRGDPDSPHGRVLRAMRGEDW